MPQFIFTVNKPWSGLPSRITYRIIALVPTLHLALESLPQIGDSKIISASSLTLNLPQSPKRFYRHGWQSWALTTWLEPSEPPHPVRLAEFRMKDEDPGYALHKNHISAWVGAVELGDEDILLLGALNLGGRVELDGRTLKGFYESVGQDARHWHRTWFAHLHCVPAQVWQTMQVSLPPSEWFLARGHEDDVFSSYAQLLGRKFGKGRFDRSPRVWCSWYSLYAWINERIILKTLEAFGDMPFGVFQVDDGWQLTYGDWEANRKFPSGMKALAENISATGRAPGLWLAPFMVSSRSRLARNHPEWLLRNERGERVHAGITWSGNPLVLDSSHPEVLEWLDQLIRKVRTWGYAYLKLDFLYLGALIGKRQRDTPREVAYRNALQVIREAAGDAYLLASGAPIIPSLGLCDGLRIGPDVSPYWLNEPLTVWLNNPNDTSTQNSIRTSIHRLWLKPLVNVDPDVVFFRSRHNALRHDENQLLEDLGTITGFKATSDLPGWMTAADRQRLTEFLESTPVVRKMKRYRYQIDGHGVDFSPAVPISPSNRNIPVWLAKSLGILKILTLQALPAIWESKSL